MPRDRGPSKAPRRPASLARTVCSLLLLCGQVLPPAQALGYTLAETGRWTPRQAWEQAPIHVGLLRGNGAPHHSRVVWWLGKGHHEIFFGGLWGWRPSSDTCIAYPDTSVLMRLPFEEQDAGSSFCSGHTQLADGKLFLAGGTQPGTEFGIRNSMTFDGLADSTAAWQDRDSMEAARWYPSATTLADGRVVVLAGTHHQHLQFFGGLKNAESTPTDSSLFRYGIGEGGVSDAAVTPSGAAVWPGPREGHSSAYGGEVTRIFGGRTQAGALTADVFQMRRRENLTGADYSYDWEKVTPLAGVAPKPRWRHTAVRTVHDSSQMVVFGGVGKNDLDQDEALSDVWRYLFRNGQGYRWNQVEITNPTSSDAPGARTGHAALWHAQSQSMLVFGGRSTPTGAPADSALYKLTFNSTMSSATWTKLEATGPSPRSEMALAFDPNSVVNDHRHAYAFGGNLASGKSNELWRLEIEDASDSCSCSWEKVTNLGGTPPSPRSGHTMHLDGGNHWLYVFGGRNAGNAADDTVYKAQLDSMKVLLGELRQWVPYARHSVALSGHTMAFEDGAIVARKPEIYQPSNNTWSTLGVPQVLDWYPQAFVLKPDTVFVAGPDEVGRKLSIGSGNWTLSPPDTTADFRGGAAVMYEPGKIMKAGSRDSDGKSGATHGTTRSVNFVSGSTPAWVASSNSMAPRVNHNLVLLPNGQVLAVGGTSVYGNNNNSSSELRPEIWDPTYGGGVGRWNGLGVLASQPTLRDYHSTALLLPDGRVLCGGGNSNDTLRTTAEIYCPPYLFNGDVPATRPTLVAATGRWRYGADVTFAVSGDTTIRRVCLIHAGSTTHGQDMAQRYVPLTLLSRTVREDGISEYFLKAPPDSFAAPPGDYMLFASNSAGVPSVAQWVRVGSTHAGQYDTTAPDTLTLSVELVTSNAIYPTWTAPGDDGSSRTALDYDIRYSTAAITTSNFESNTQVPSLPIPWLSGSAQGDTVSSLASCTWFYLASKTRDRAENWSAMGGRTKIKTLCSGGGGGLSMARTRDGGVSGRAASSTRAGGANGTLATSMTGSGSTTRLIGEFSLNPSPRWRIYLRDMSEDGIALTAANDVMLQDQTSEGGWRTRSTPRVGAGSLGIRSLVRDGRVIFPAGSSLESVALTPVAFSCEQAIHSRLGDVSESLAEAEVPEISVGDTLEIEFAALPSSGEGEDCFFRVVIPGEATSSSARREASPGARSPEVAMLPTEFALHAAQPNPFARATSVRFDLPRSTDVKLEVFDIQGRRVAVLENGLREAGRHMAKWDGRTNAGARAGGGVYLCRMTAGEFHAERRITLIP